MKPAKKPKADEMRSEYDFSEAERGKFYRPLDKGYTVHVQQSDGTIAVNRYTLAEGTVALEPDVLEYFPDSQSVNEALRLLIHLAQITSIRKYGSRKMKMQQAAEKK